LSENLRASFPSRFKAALIARLDPGLGGPAELGKYAQGGGRVLSVFISLLLALLEPFSIVYGAIVAVRNSQYERGRLKTYRPPCPTICIGNITTGGSGKTPAVILVCQLLREMGKRVVVLSRGYGRSKRSMHVLTPGDLNSLDAREASHRFGDEVIAIATHLKDMAVVVAADRAAAARAACERLNPDVLVMDDGFRHRRLERDLDILMFDAEYPFANRRLLPCGMLREPLWAIERARVAIISRSERCKPDELKAAEDAIRRHAPEITVLRSIHRPIGLRRLSDAKAFDLSHLSGKRALAFCGIARPESFFSTLSALGASPTGVPFPDHHAYTREEVMDLLSQRQSGGFDLLVTTEKDAPRLAGLSDDQARLVLVLRVEMALVGQGAVEKLRGPLEHAQIV